MDDNEILRSHSDDEYHFPEDETVASFATQKVASEKSRGLKKKNIFIAIVIVLLILCIYKLSDVLLSSHKDHTITVGHVTTSTLTQNENMPTVPQASPDITAQAPATPVASMDDRLTSVENLSSANQSNIEKLTSQMSDMQATLSNINDKMQTLTSDMQDLTNKVQLQQAQMSASEAVRVKPPVIRHIRFIPPPMFFVKTMIPNRAWLVGPGGRTTTVSIGDSLPGYGVIVVIDPEQGTLTTSTGAIIGYSPNDR